MLNLVLEASGGIPVSRRQVELVERKGVGHPDAICDALLEAASVALSQEYLKAAGRVLHHNLDKSLLVAGQSSPALLGGTIDVPLRLVFGDRATDQWQGTRIPVGEIVAATARKWFSDHLRFVDPARHVVLQNEIRPGSPELVDIFARDNLTANDTSAAVGFAPLSETERLVLAAERYLNSADFKQRYPESGEDVKVMGSRRGRALQLTVAMAFVDRFIASEAQYFDRKEAILGDLDRKLRVQLDELDDLSIQFNTLDVRGRGLGGMYLTVLGTSAEGADGGEVGRGNRVNGLISLNRPMTMEAAAGKNPVSHVGKIYNLLSHQMAGRIYAEVEGLEEVYVWLCSQIGRALDDPWAVSIQLSLRTGRSIEDVQRPIEEIVASELADIRGFTERLCRGEIAVC